MENKYEKGSILKYDNGDVFVVCHQLIENKIQYLLVMKLDEEIGEKIVIDYNKMMMLKVLENDDTVVEDDEKIISEIYNKMVEEDKIEYNNQNN